MQKLLLLAIVLFAFLIVVNSTIIPHFRSKKGDALPRYKLQLNDPPIQRWVIIARTYKDEIKKVIKGLDDLRLPSGFYDMVTAFTQTYPDQEFVQEI